MVLIGYALSSEEHPPELVRIAGMAQRGGFQGLWISDHFHPWNQQQGESPFVWAVLGAISQVTSEIPVTTAVTCPTVRIHPAIVAQAAATSATLLPGRFRLGLGSGEALNEHILGGPWPRAEIRLQMLEEAVELMRRLWQGSMVSHEGRHFRVELARLYSLPETPPPVWLSGFGRKAVELAARIGDGYCGVRPDPELVAAFEAAGGAGKPRAGSLKVCWAESKEEGRRTAHRLWPNDALPGELSQLLPTPAHFEQASSLVSEEQVAAEIVCGPDPERHRKAIQSYIDAGYDEVYVSQIGPEQEGFFDFYAAEVLPSFA